MRGEDGCTCDYSYTCPKYQARIDAINQAEYLDEVKAWTADETCVVCGGWGTLLRDGQLMQCKCSEAKGTK